MENSGFFNAVLSNGVYDRVYLADAFAQYFRSFLSNGVFGGSSQELQVVAMANPTMQVSILAGRGYINGYWYENTAPFIKTLSQSDGLNPRIDSIVLRWDNTARVINLVVVAGTPAQVPVPPVIVRNPDYYDLKLCNIRVNAGSTNVQQSAITDTRLDKSVCGFVYGLIDQFDTTAFGIQMQDFMDTFTTQSQVDFENWFDTIKGILGDDEAANLLALIQDLQSGKLDKSSVYNGTDMTSTGSALDAYQGKILNDKIVGRIPMNYNVTLSVAGWIGSAVPYTQTVTVNGITALDEPIVDVVVPKVVASAIQTLESYGYVDDIDTGANTITAYCYTDKPSVALNIRLKVLR